MAENKSYREVLTAIAKSINTKAPHIKVNKFLAGMAWRLAKIGSFLAGKKPLVTKQTAKSSLSETRYSSNKIEKALDFSFTPIDKVITETGHLFLKDN